ncbi:MAG: stage 0 sporulation family protein [Chloroflexota bacterium]|nr:stage 0 sporulation family protein [Chloroflexota bacterium]
MPDVVGVRFKRAGKIYYFDPAGIELVCDDLVVVETGRGPEVGRVVIAPTQVLASDTAEPLKPVLRKAEEEDLAQQEELKAKGREAMAKCHEMIARYNLPMKLLAAEYNLDCTRLTFSFSAEGRVDFRELLKELTAYFKTRIELRQVGPRDEAKLLGGIGRCGRPLCCTTYLSEFNPVSIKMAKEQDLPLNPMKISGTCGRLACCLSHESELYRTMKERLPATGKQVVTPTGPAIVVGGNALKETVMVRTESGVVLEVPLSELTVRDERGARPPRKKGGG